MRKFFVFVASILGAVLLLVALYAPVGAQEKPLQHQHVAVCSRENGSFSCHARVLVDQNGKPLTTVSPYGFGPAQFTNAYGVVGLAAAVPTIAIVDAYDDPAILSDVNTYSAYFGIHGLSSCPAGPVASSCLQKVNQYGTTQYPSRNSGWDLEISLDVEVAHSMCPTCNILLVEASSASYSNLMTAVDRAVIMGAKVISNSYGSSEFSTETSYDTHFKKSGIAFTFSSGDSGYGVEYPAASQYVTAVGGTSLSLSNTGSYSGETVWSGAGSGCSKYESQPVWQQALGLVGCSNRVVADVSADADPNTGAAVYDSVSYAGQRGWFTVGGTSLASPLIASVYAISGNLSASAANSLPYGSTGLLHDVTSGSNGSCSVPYLCTGIVGYDGPSGLGTPNGTSGF